MGVGRAVNLIQVYLKQLHVCQKSMVPNNRPTGMILALVLVSIK